MQKLHLKIRGGFTLIELVMVIAVTAIVATLAISAAIKASRHGDQVRIQATCVALKSALANYRAAESRWPVALEMQGSEKIIVFREDNAKVFSPLIMNPKKVGLDVSALLTKVPGKGVMPLKNALEQNIAPEMCSIGCPDPANRSNFVFFKVSFNLELETVNVEWE
jgi:prepilin-type N-terminal cleavage/methylation domain-containing protein